MSRFTTVFSLVVALGAIVHWAITPVAGQDVDEAQEKAIKAAVAKVAPSIVQIETSGGSDLVGSGPRGPQIRKGAGPTTGVVVSADGFIISSAFNFANKPSAIFVAIPGKKERLVAKVVATDKTRMLTLLKVEATGLPMPTAAPREEIKVGQWALALGRTWAGLETPPSVSIGIVSALNRIWNKAIQTDAKVSPVNYGGPLVDVQGRVMGILVPASPRGQDETAGVEWYDAGIGFAIPLADIQAVLPKLKEGKNLSKGMLGVSIQGEDIYGQEVVIASVAPDSAALKAGIKAGDVIVEIDGHSITRHAQLMHALGNKYEGDPVSVKVRREKEVLAFNNLKLTGASLAHQHAFLGVLAMRDDPELGEEIRYVFPKSPAELAGLKAGDRIGKLSFQSSPMLEFSGRDDLTALLDSLQSGNELKLEVKRKESQKTESVKVTLGALSDTVPESLPAESSAKKALTPRKTARQPRPQPKDGEPRPKLPDLKKNEPKKEEPKQEEKKTEEKKKAETGLLKRTTPAGDREYWAFVPPNYDPNISHGLVVWLHPAGRIRDKEKETEQIIAGWEDYCAAHHLILLCPKAESEAGWIASDADFIIPTARALMNEYTIDRQRVVAHGMGIGGQFAYYLGFNSGDLFRGIATAGATMNSQPKKDQARRRLFFFVVAGGKDPLAEAIAESKNKLVEYKFPTVFKEMPEMGHQYLDDDLLHELVLWIDSLDRQ